MSQDASTQGQEGAGQGLPPLGPLIESIPAELRALSQWVAYTWPGKVPVNPATMRKAKTNKPETWGRFAQAVELWQAYQDHGMGGVGFVLSPDDPYCVVDLNGCRNSKTGAIEPWAKDIITRLNSYTELSPSGRGVHILARGNLPGEGRGRSIARGTGKVQLRGERFFFTMTGLHLAGTPVSIADRQGELSALYFETYSWGRGATPQDPGPSPGQENGAPDTLSQDDLVQLAGTLRRQGRGEAGIRRGLQGINQASAAPMPESVIDRIARSAARHPPGLNWKGDPQAAVWVIGALADPKKGVRYKDLKDRIKKDRNCSDTTAKGVIQKALDKRLIVKGKNGFKGYKIKNPFRRVTHRDG